MAPAKDGAASTSGAPVRELLLKLVVEAIADIAAKALGAHSGEEVRAAASAVVDRAARLKADLDRALAEGDARVDAAVEDFTARNTKPPEE